ncbi:phage holin family protein [uncultured Dokdonia sp.]|uniref:phage holin family protein n=1 Tax=uncultured Dokdonia sp. TaxID=575653 RepID=UPI002606BF24|nr:phage holin family protein [uncultured Dokdonia sp.]
MKSIFKIILTTIAVLVIAKILPGVHLEEGFMTPLCVAIVLSLLRFIVRPILVILTLPITIVTFGFFLLVINAILILLVDYFIGGFEVNGVLTALLFSILLSIFQSILFQFLKEDVKQPNRRN